MHEYFHVWSKEITDPKHEDPAKVEEVWIKFQVRHRDSMVVAQEAMREHKNRANEIWTRVKDIVRRHKLAPETFSDMDADFNEIFAGYGKLLVLSTRRWETLIAKVTAHGGINAGAHKPVMRCAVCNEDVDLHDWILKFDQAVSHSKHQHDWQHIEGLYLISCADETQTDNFAEWANHLHIPSTCGADQAWIHRGPKDDL